MIQLKDAPKDDRTVNYILKNGIEDGVLVLVTEGTFMKCGFLTKYCNYSIFVSAHSINVIVM